MKVGPPGRAQDFVGITVAPIGVRIKGKDLAITEENIDERKGLAVMGVEFLVSLGGGELSEPTRVSVGGLPGFRWEASHVKVRRDGRVDLLLTEVFRGTTSYTVSCGYTPEAAAEVKAACDQVLDSFRVEPGGGAANSTGAVLFSDDFSNTRSGWDVGGNRDRSMAYVNGRYRIAIRKSVYGPSVSHDLDHPSQAISVTAVLRQSAGGRGDGLGVACVSKRPTVGYELLIGPRDRGSDTANMIVKTFREHKKPDALTWGDDEAVKPRGAVNRIRVDCVGASARTPARLTLYANGKLILQATDPRGYKRFEAIGLYAWSNAGGTTSLFDDLVVRELKRAG